MSAPATTPALVDCPVCGGGGEVGYEPMDWWYGSGVNVVLSPCSRCDGEGCVTPDVAAEIAAERAAADAEAAAAEAQRAAAAAEWARANPGVDPWGPL